MVGGYLITTRVIPTATKYSVMLQLMYWYTVVHHNAVKMTTLISDYIAPEQPIKCSDSTIIWMKNNKEIVNPANYVDSECVLCKVDNLVRVLNYETVVSENPPCNFCESSVSFISITVKWMTGVAVGTEPITIYFKGESCENFYVDGNDIDKYIIWYIVKQKYGMDMYGEEYVLYLMDGNVNMRTIGTESVIHIHKDTYTISV